MPKVAVFNLNAVIHYMPAFLMGILFKKYEDSILTFINRGGVFKSIDCKFINYCFNYI